MRRRFCGTLRKGRKGVKERGSQKKDWGYKVWALVSVYEIWFWLFCGEFSPRMQCSGMRQGPIVRARRSTQKTKDTKKERKRLKVRLSKKLVAFEERAVSSSDTKTPLDVLGESPRCHIWLYRGQR